MTDYLLYFPSVKEFTSLKEINSRVGFPPFQLTDNYGLFIKEVILGDFKSGVGKIKFIKASKAEETKDKMKINITFDLDNPSINKINLERSYGGYYSSYIQPYLNMVNEENKNELYDQFIKSMSEEITIIDKQVFNDKAELFGIEPFIINADIESETFSVKAGNKILFKLGELIGKQIEMYQENDRQLAVESDFTRIYERLITLNIPEGYSIINLDDINIHHFFDKKGERLLEFHSYYEIENNILKVNANEFYKINRIETNHFEDYRNVINGAADFNKIVLVLEEK